MYQVGDFVTYKDSGICKIVEDNQDYYILDPVYSKNMTMYVPKKTQSLVDQMKDVISKEDIISYVKKADHVKCQWIEDSKLRCEEFNRILKAGEKDELLWLIKVLSSHKEKLESNRKNMYATDKRILASAYKIITEEFAFVLNIEPNQVLDYVENLKNR